MLSAIHKRISFRSSLITKPQVEDALGVLSDKELQVMGMRFPFTQEETGEQLGISKEAVRQIEARSIDKMLKKLL